MTRLHTDDVEFPDLRSGTVVLGSFQLVKPLGQGGFATAFLARQLGTDRHAVIKVPHARLVTGTAGEEVKARFETELRAATRVAHPHIATVYVAGDVEPGIPAFAMEYVPGPALDSMLTSSAPLPLRDIELLGSQIASALHAIHAVGIVHRDVTPRNLIASEDSRGARRYVLLDFGIAKLGHATSGTLGPLGTPRYMSREQIKGRPVRKSDMYSLGAILWWALTGQEYFSEFSGNVYQLLIHQIERASLVDPREVNPTIPAPIARLVSELMHKDVAHRPTADEFLAVWPGLMAEWRARAHDTGEQPRRSADRAPDAIQSHHASEELVADGGAHAETLVQEPGPSGSGSGSRMMLTMIERFVGAVPDWLLDLEDAVTTTDLPLLTQLCRQIHDSAQFVGADHLARCAEIACQLAHNQLLEEAIGFIDELRNECYRTSQDLLVMHQTLTGTSNPLHQET